MAKFKPSTEDQLVTLAPAAPLPWQVVPGSAGVLPIPLQDQLVPGTLEHTISRLLNQNVDLSVLDGQDNNDETGATAIHPKILLKIILLAF